jgi:hypothetical protein
MRHQFKLGHGAFWKPVITQSTDVAPALHHYARNVFGVTRNM